MPNKDRTVYKAVDRMWLANASDRTDWPRQHAWLIDRLKRLEAVFADPVEEALAAYEREMDTSAS